MLQLLRRSGEVRQGDLAELTLHDETTLTRNLRPLVDAGWDRRPDRGRPPREVVTITAAEWRSSRKPARVGAGQVRMQALLPEGAWQRLLAILPEIAKLTAGA